MQTTKERLLSRKFLLTVVVMALILLNDTLELGLDRDTLTGLLVGNGIFVAGEATVDAVRASQQVTHDEV